MSMDLPEGAVMAPHHRGLIEGDDEDDPTQYSYYAYRHPHGLSWFGGFRREPNNPTQNGGCTHYIQSGHRGRRIPPKPDEAVAAINADEFIELTRMELLWWADYNTKYLELATAWAAIHFPGFHIRHLRVPGLCKYQAAKWAHRLVARRAGLEHELPADHDTRRYVVADEGIDWDLM